MSNPQPAANQKSKHQKQAPDRDKEQSENSGVLGFGLLQPFDKANGREQAERASAQANKKK